MQYANLICYTDVLPFEVVRVISDKTIEIREMKAEIDFKPELVKGGFAAHCTNNTEAQQQWIITSDNDAPIVRARLQKNGKWKSQYGEHRLADKPRKFYDYNF